MNSECKALLSLLRNVEHIALVINLLVWIDFTFCYKECQKETWLVMYCDFKGCFIMLMKILLKAVNVIRMSLSFKFYIWKERGLSECVLFVYVYILLWIGLFWGVYCRNEVLVICRGSFCLGGISWDWWKLVKIFSRILQSCVQIMLFSYSYTL